MHGAAVGAEILGKTERPSTGRSAAGMANWGPLRQALATVADRVTFNWSELDTLVGGLPPSAYNHAAFWKGDRSGWPGFTTTDVRVGASVTFVRRSSASARSPRSVERPPPVRWAHERPDLLLLGCVKQKLDHPAEARDLYTSPLFRKERAYAEAAGCPWFVLSAQHGLVHPTTVLAPYDLQLSKTSGDYRRRWGKHVLDQLQDTAAPLAGKVIEVHAGSAYVDAIRDGLIVAGADVVEPLHGLTMGERLSWYLNPAPMAMAGEARQTDVAALIEILASDRDAQTPSEFLATAGDGLRLPGMYSWWVDEAGSQELTVGIGRGIAPGLIYAGLAGATRSRSGRRSKNTLWGRIRGMHLGSRHEFSTFRLTLGSVLANAWGEDEIDEARLTEWMHDHLRVVAVPVADADTLDPTETQVLQSLDPPLNLHKMPASPIRAQLTDLRRKFGRRRSS